MVAAVVATHALRPRALETISLLALRHGRDGRLDDDGLDVGGIEEGENGGQEQHAK